MAFQESWRVKQQQQQQQQQQPPSLSVPKDFKFDQIYMIR
jgi:hypothetical protein